MKWKQGLFITVRLHFEGYKGKDVFKLSFKKNSAHCVKNVDIKNQLITLLA